MKVRRFFFWFFLRNLLFSWIPHPCTSVGLRPAGFGRTWKSPQGLFSGRAGMRFLLVASLPQKRFLLFSRIYLFVQTHSSPSMYLCMCAQMSSRSHSYHPCKIVRGWYKNDKYLAKGNVLEWMNGSCEWRWLWQHSTMVAMISPSVGAGESRGNVPASPGRGKIQECSVRKVPHSSKTLHAPFKLLCWPGLRSGFVLNSSSWNPRLTQRGLGKGKQGFVIHGRN